jgi:hypothetical protein
LDDLKPGDTILTTTTDGTFMYVVSKKLTVLPNQASVVGDYGDDRLTLTTCTPQFSASHRLIVVAMLGGRAPAAPPAHSAVPAVPRAQPLSIHSPAADQLRREAQRGFDFGALLPALLWGSLIIGVALAYVPARRRLPPLATVVVLAPVWLLVLVLLFEQLNRFLPPNV